MVRVSKGLPSSSNDNSLLHMANQPWQARHMNKPLIGISTCLLGEQVRYDGGHQLDRYLRDVLGNFVDYEPVCPEVECGMPIPRESLRLVGSVEKPRLITRKSGEDHTKQMQDWAKGRLEALREKPLCGYVFKAKSPSSGMERVRVYPIGGGQAVKKGVGVWARAFIDEFPYLPVEEDGRLHDPVLRENFIERIFVVHRWRLLCEERLALGKLVDFHTRHKLLLLAHSQSHYRQMGRLVAHGKEKPLKELYDQYFIELMTALKLRATVKKHVNVLSHVQGYFKKLLTADEKQEAVELISSYQQGLVPLIVPITLLNHYVRKYDEKYLKQQLYLNPHPAELKLRNHC